MRRHFKERGLLSACTGQVALELVFSTSTALPPVCWCVVSLLLTLHFPRRELSPLYTSLGLRFLRPWLLLFFPPHAAIVSFWPLHSVLDSIAVVLVALAWALSCLFPWPDFSRLHGPHPTIGCHSVRLGGVECRVFYPSPDDDRPETANLNPTRRFVPYLHHGRHLMTGLGVFTNLPSWLFHNMSNARLAALQDAPVASPPTSSDGWSIVIFSHGLAGSLELYSCVNQELASHGLVVVVPNHCDGSACVCSPEPGRIEYYQQIPSEVRADVDGAGFRFRNGQLQERVSEVRSVLDAIIKHGTAADNVFNQCNLDSVSVAGHSFGAATALTVAHQDERFKKMVLLDAWMEPLDDDVRDGLGSCPCASLGVGALSSLASKC